MSFGHSLEKKENLTENDILLGVQNTEIAQNQGDRWTFVAVLPESSFIHTVHSSERTLEQAQVFVGAVKRKSDQKAPLFHSDCWFYEQALRDNYCTYEAIAYCGKGRPAHPKQVVDSELCYVQVHKKRNSKGKIEDISTRIVLGDETKIFNIFHDACRCKTVNTDFVESRNGKYRKDDARLIRRTLCHSKKALFHDAHICFVTQVYNYTRTVDALKIMINPNARKFQTKYQHKTPAMAENVIDRILSLKDLLFIRPKLLS
jgi:IS1 family transposase